MSIKFEPPSEEELAARGIVSSPERSREEDGTFKGDDPSTIEINEAWVKKPSRRKGAKK